MTKKLKEQTDEPAQVSRRQFAKTIVALAVAAPVVSSIYVDAQTPPTKQAPAPPNPAPTPTPKPSPLAEAYGEVAQARFGDKLTPEQLTQVKRELEGNVRTADRLRAVKLQNADEPDFVFAA